jgi:hypothetical protein
MPMLAVVLHREKNKRLLGLFVLVLCVGLGVSSLVLLRDTVRQEKTAQQSGQKMMDAADYLLENGYTHGYGTFWNIRVMEERTEGALTFTVLMPVETEPGATTPYAPSLMRWGEMDCMSDLDISPDKAFLLLTHEEQADMGAWLTHTGAPMIFENETYVVYGFESSQAFTVAMMEGRMTLDNAQALGEGAYLIHQGGRLRIPPDWREAGSYMFSFTVEGDVQADSVVRVYSGKQFEVIAQQPLASGENKISFELAHDDKYSMIQIRAESAQELHVSSLALDKVASR